MRSSCGEIDPGNCRFGDDLRQSEQAYVTNVNGALDKFPELAGLGLVDLNKAVGSDKIPAEVATVVRNNGGGHWNHSFL